MDNSSVHYANEIVHRKAQVSVELYLSIFRRKVFLQRQTIFATPERVTYVSYESFQKNKSPTMYTLGMTTPIDKIKLGKCIPPPSG